MINLNVLSEKNSSLMFLALVQQENFELKLCDVMYTLLYITSNIKYSLIYSDICTVEIKDSGW